MSPRDICSDEWVCYSSPYFTKTRFMKR